MDKKLFHALQVRYVKLRFTVAFLEDSILPKDKASAIRGGIGEMLLRMNCIRNRQCEICDFETECIVQKIMYSKFENKPYFVTTGGSVGYVLECENIQEQFKAGEKLDFYFILFGKTIVYFNQLYQAVSMLGEQEGIGKNHAKFQIAEIRNTDGVSILEKNVVHMEKYVIHILYDYILFRRMQMGEQFNKKKVKLWFDTPVTLKYHNEFLQEFQIEPILRAIRRRLYMLNCFEEIDSNILEQEEGDFLLHILSKEHYQAGISRYSVRKNEKMVLRGLKGHLLLDGLTEDTLTLLLIGELIHIGKNSSFGFGKYHLKILDD